MGFFELTINPFLMILIIVFVNVVLMAALRILIHISYTNKWGDANNMLLYIMMIIGGFMFFVFNILFMCWALTVNTLITVIVAIISVSTGFFIVTNNEEI